MQPRIKRELLAWYDANRRDMPWRRTRDPYRVWVSEVMLQQTQVATVLPYYERWVQRFPRVESLAAANEQEVLSIWQGLGYYRRCRLLLEGARYVVAKGMPASEAEWRRVPGVGPYTAAAIASICSDEPSAVVDGNVERVFARLTACESTGSALLRAAWAWASSQIPSTDPGNWNQALMELGATVCKPREPTCSVCPLKENCLAFRLARQTSLPVPKPRSNPLKMTAEAWVYTDGTHFGVEQVPAGEWAEGLWRFPTSERRRQPLQVREERNCNTREIGEIKYVVTNHKVTLSVRLIACEGSIPSLAWHTHDALENLPMPAPQRRALKLVHEFLSRAPRRS